MALTYTGTGGLFTRLGSLIYMLDAVRTHQANLKTLLANVQGDYSSADSWMIDQVAGRIDLRISDSYGVISDIRASAEKTLVEMCFSEANSTSASFSMKSKSISDALIWLIRQMRADSQTVKRCGITKSSTTFGASNVGQNAKFVWLTKTPNVLLGGMTNWEGIRTEILEARVVQDSVSGIVQPGTEIWEVRGQPSYIPLDYRFPAGSGIIARMPTACAVIDAGGRNQNILTNSDLEDQTTNLPDQWTVSSGTAGTHFQTETTAANVFRGTKALKLLAGTGGTFSIRQQLGTATGTVGRIIPDRPYVIAFAIKVDATAAGAVRVCVKDGSGNLIDSDATAPYTVSGLASYSIVTATFRAPINVPAACYVHLETTTTITNAAVYVDEIVVAELMPIAPGGQAIGMVAGSTDFRVDDSARFSFTNDGAGKFQVGFDRLFGMYLLGLQLPSAASGSETISDTLIA